MNKSIRGHVVKVDKNRLIINNSKTIEVMLPSNIEEVVTFENVLVVRIHPKASAFINENVFGISILGKVLWQIKAIKHVYNNSPYTGIFKKGKVVKAHNWDGTDLTVNPLTGKILQEGYSK